MATVDFLFQDVLRRVNQREYKSAVLLRHRVAPIFEGTSGKKCGIEGNSNSSEQPEDVVFAHMYHFVCDRLRCVRQEFVIQGVGSCVAQYISVRMQNSLGI